MGVELRSIEHSYPGGVRALRGLDLRAEDGEFLVILGASGSGKTTLLRIVGGLLRPTAGEVRLDGVPATGQPPRARSAAWVPQDAALFPHLTVRDNLAFGPRVRGASRREARRAAEEAARTLGLEALLGRRPATLSGGERRRIALGRALVRRPRRLLLDEPLAGLDGPLRRRLRGELRELHRRLAPAVTLLVTHDQADALALADRLALIRDGQVLDSGPPADLWSAPRHAGVARFLGDPPMNLLEARGTLEAGRPVLRVEGTALSLPLPGRRTGPLLVGVRPEALRAVPGPDPAALKVRVERLEFQGARELVHARTPGGQPLTWIADPGQAPGPGEERLLTAPAEALRLFRPDGPAWASEAPRDEAAGPAPGARRRQAL